MRFAVIFVAACTGSYYGDVGVAPTGGPPLGVDLTQRYTVAQDLCESGYDSDGCESQPTTHTAVAIESSPGVDISIVDGATFDLTGTVAGTTVLAVSGNDDTTASVPIVVADVGTTTLFVHHTPGNTVSLPDVYGGAQAFTGSWIAMGQHSVGPDQSARAGTAKIVAEQSFGLVVLQPDCDCFTIGNVLGTATLAAPHGTFELDIVAGPAIAAFTINGTIADVGVNMAAGPEEVFFVPTDAAGRTIVGQGPEPSVTIVDPTIATLVFDHTIGDERAAFVRGLKTGATEVDVTWAGVQRTFFIRVI